MKIKLKILLTNDDGFHADGLQTLYQTLKDVADVRIAAPDREQSAVGHGITINRPLRVTPFKQEDGEHWMIDGTPSDCVKLALETLLKDWFPDLILSGINRGPNLGNDVLYSGTVAAAFEGSFYRVPSIAASLAGFGKLDFHKSASFLREHLSQLSELAKDAAVLNLNFPSLDDDCEYQGLKLTKLGRRIYENVFEERFDPRGKNYYWMGGEPVSSVQDIDSDIQAVDDNYVSLTPLKSDMTDYDILGKMTIEKIFQP